MTTIKRYRITALLLMAGLFIFLILSPGFWRWAMGGLFPDLDRPVYDMATLAQLAWEHFIMVGVSSGLAVVIGLITGISVTRSWGKDFLPTVNALASMGQTFPPVAVLALAVPVVGFGFKPTVIALLLYGLLPIIRNTITGIGSVDTAVLDAARGMGMTPVQVLTSIELPLASPVVMAGVRISTVINIGTATLGATIGAGGLGKPIIAGLIGENPAFILEGAILVGLFAIIVDGLLGLVVESGNLT